MFVLIGTYSPLKKKKILAGRMDEATLRPMGVLAPKLHNIFINILGLNSNQAQGK